MEPFVLSARIDRSAARRVEPESDDAALAVETTGLSRRYGRRWALADVSLAVARGLARHARRAQRLGQVHAAARARDGAAPRPRQRAGARPRRAARARGGPAPGGAARPPLVPVRGAHGAREPRGRRELPGRRAATATRCCRCSSAVGLAERADDPVASFSAGMRKRLSLARVLLQDAALVLLDEPYGELDPPGFELLDGADRRAARRGARP